MSDISAVPVRDAATSRFEPDAAKGAWRPSRNSLLSPALFVALLALWESAVRLLDIPIIVLPPPSAVLKALGELITSATFEYHLAVTVFEVLTGFAAGSASGMLLGIAIGQSRFVERLIYPYVVAFQTIPKVAIAPIIVIWFGYGLSSKVVITAMISFFPVLANTIVGLRSAPLDQVEMLRAYTANRWQIFRLVLLPQALPFIFAGLDVAAVLAVIGAIVGEFVGAKAGLGFLILQKNFSFDMAGVFAILIVLSLIGLALHGGVMLAQRRFLFWAKNNRFNPVAGA